MVEALLYFLKTIGFHSRKQFVIHKHSKMLIWIFLLFTAFSPLPAKCYAGEWEKRRIWAGLELFPSFLAADLDIENKSNSKGSLLLVLLYRDNREPADEMAVYLREIQKIKGLPIHVEVTTDEFLKNYSSDIPAGIFLTERFISSLDSIISFGINYHVMVFSPFESDVERGVPVGIRISDRILPLVNIKAMHSSNIRLKASLLRISEQYGQ